MRSAEFNFRRILIFVLPTHCISAAFLDSSHHGCMHAFVLQRNCIIIQSIAIAKSPPKFQRDTYHGDRWCKCSSAIHKFCRCNSKNSFLSRIHKYSFYYYFSLKWMEFPFLVKYHFRSTHKNCPLAPRLHLQTVNRRRVESYTRKTKKNLQKCKNTFPSPICRGFGPFVYWGRRQAGLERLGRSTPSKMMDVLWV